jgi:hypothetical protein
MSHKNDECPFEQEVILNLESGDVKTHIQEHIASCTLCQETVTVYRFMNDFSTVSMMHPVQEKSLPSVDSIWDGAFAAPMPFTREEPDEELVQKALLPMKIAQYISYFVIAIGSLYFLVDYLPGIKGLFNLNMGGDSFVRIFSSIFEKGTKVSLFMILPVVIALISIIVFMLISDREPGEAKKLSS